MSVFLEVLNTIVLLGTTITVIFAVITNFSKPGRFFRRKRDESLKEKIVVEITEALEDYSPRFEELINMIKANKTETDKTLEIMMKGNRDVLRQKIMTIYRANRRKMKISLYDRESIDELYKDYKAHDGNSYIDKYYNRTKKWEVIKDSFDTDDDAE